MKLTASLTNYLTELVDSAIEDIKMYDMKIATAKQDIETFTKYKAEAEENIRCLTDIINSGGININAEKKNVKRNVSKA